jgi:hypothetical protein
MAINYDSQILSLYAGNVANDPAYESIRETLRDEISEHRILTTIEVLRAHMETLNNIEDARLLGMMLSRLMEKVGSGGNVYAPIRLGVEGTVRNPVFAAGAKLDVVVDGVSIEHETATGGSASVVAAELTNVVSSEVEVTEITTVADVLRSLSGTFFYLNSPTTAYYVWMFIPGLEGQFTVNTSAAIPTDAGTDLPDNGTGAYFVFNSPNNDYYVWMNIDGGNDDPMVPGATGVEVALLNTDDANEVAEKIATAIDGLADVSTTITPPSPSFTVDMDDRGEINAPVDGSVATGFVFNLTIQGVDDGEEPSVFGRTGIAATVPVGSTADAVATAVAAAIDAVGNFNASAVANVVTVTNDDPGTADDAIDFNTGFSFDVTTQGVSEDAVVFFVTSDGRLAIRNGVGHENTSFTLIDGTPSVLQAAGISPVVTVQSKPEEVSEQARDRTISRFVTRPR